MKNARNVKGYVNLTGRHLHIPLDKRKKKSKVLPHFPRVHPLGCQNPMAINCQFIEYFRPKL